MTPNKAAICTKCRTELRVPGQRWCRGCRRAYEQTRRRPYRELPEAGRRQAICRSYVHELIRRGHLKPESCRECGTYPAEAHHENYDEPRVIVWLCRTHRMRRCFERRRELRAFVAFLEARQASGQGG